MTTGCKKHGRLVALLVLVLAAVVAYRADLLGRASQGLAGEPETTEPLSEQQLAQLSQLSHAIRTVAKSVRQSVVHVEVKEFAKQQPSQSRIPDDLREQLKRFFGGDIPFWFEMPSPGPRAIPRHGIGSGIIMDRKGHILTNNHVVESADKIVVVTADGIEYEAKIVGTDPLTDLAVLKIKAKDLKPARFGDSDEVEVGDLVLAVGNPFGLDYSVTFGIISAKGRSGLNLGRVYYQDFIQTDAAINPGNSGGPLVNIKGEVVGVNTAIATRTGQYAGVGFAIPANLAKKIARILIEKGKVIRGWLGVSIQNLTPGLAKSFGLKSTDGVLVSDVVPDSPAERAGFKPEDIILEMNGRKVKNAQQLQQMVTLTPPGTEVEFKVWRKRKIVKLQAKLGELKEKYLFQARPGIRPPGEEGGKYEAEELGITVATPTEALAKKYGWKAKPQAVIVVDVDPTGEAYDLGIRPGDAIESVQDMPTPTAEDFAQAMKKVSLREGFRMRVVNPVRGRRILYVQVIK